MRTRVSTILIASLSLAGGGAARWLTFHPTDPADVRKRSDGLQAGIHSSGGRAQAGGNSSPADGSKETRAGIEEILALRGFEQFERFAEWLVDANTAEMRTFALAMKEADHFDSKLSDALMLRWVEVDAADALEGGRENGFELAAWWAWGKLNPERALAAAATENGVWKGAEALRGIAQTDPERARLLFEQYPQFENRSSLEGMVTGLSHHDPRAAAEMALRIDSTESRNHVKGWAKREPEEAFAWALQVESPAQRRKMLEAIISQWEDTNPEQIGTALEAMPAGQAKNRLLVEHASHLALTDTAAGVAYAQQLPLPAVRQAALGSIAKTLAANRPLEALEFLRQQDWKLVDPDSANNGGIYQALGLLGRSLPEEAMAFAATLGQAAGDSARRNTFSSWTDVDVGKASGWLAAQPAEQRDPGILDILLSHLSQSGPDQDFDAAVRWALTSPNLQQSPGRVQNIFEDWRRTDSAAAERALQLPGVPESVRAHFLQSKPAP